MQKTRWFKEGNEWIWLIIGIRMGIENMASVHPSSWFFSRGSQDPPTLVLISGSLKDELKYVQSENHLKPAGQSVLRTWVDEKNTNKLSEVLGFYTITVLISPWCWICWLLGSTWIRNLHEISAVVWTKAGLGLWAKESIKSEMKLQTLMHKVFYGT